MIMSQHAGWMLMLHGTAFITDIQQHAASNPTGPSPATCAQFNVPCTPPVIRGGDKFFSTNWLMPMATRQLGQNGRYGQLTLRTMFSLEPATISARQYPELFQQGETAFGKPIIDGQHPHDFFMEDAALYDLRLGEHGLLSLSAAPVGDPAIGPTASPQLHSASSSRHIVATHPPHSMPGLTMAPPPTGTWATPPLWRRTKPLTDGSI